MGIHSAAGVTTAINSINVKTRKAQAKAREQLVIKAAKKGRRV